MGSVLRTSCDVSGESRIVMAVTSFSGEIRTPTRGRWPVVRMPACINQEPRTTWSAGQKFRSRSISTNGKSLQRHIGQDDSNASETGRSVDEEMLAGGRRTERRERMTKRVAETPTGCAGSSWGLIFAHLPLQCVTNEEAPPARENACEENDWRP